MGVLTRLIAFVAGSIMATSATSSVWNGNQKVFARTALVHRDDIRQRLLSSRGGSNAVLEEEEEKQVDPEEEKKRLALQKWRMDQQSLMQLRSLFLSEELAKRGIPLTTLVDVSTAEGDKPPESVDWDCAMSTREEPKPCLYSFDAEPNTKVVAPISTPHNAEGWITLSSLNRLRRTDPSKVEPMWHSQYSILQSWFGDASEFSLMQHVGFKGFLVTVLLDSAKGMVLKSLLVLSILSLVILFMPMLEFCMNRFLVSGGFWKQWRTWGRITHAALPLKLLIGQLVWKFMARSFNKLETKVRDYVVDIECDILEESIPLTVGPGSDVPLDEDVEEYWDAEADVDMGELREDDMKELLEDYGMEEDEEEYDEDDDR